MTSRPTAERGAFTMEMRKRSGEYLRKIRLDAGLTQNEVAKALGLDYYTMISQLELGRGFCPPERYVDYAKVCGVDVREFTTQQLRFQNPWAWAILFGQARDLKALQTQDAERRPSQ